MRKLAAFAIAFVLGGVPAIAASKTSHPRAASSKTKRVPKRKAPKRPDKHAKARPRPTKIARRVAHGKPAMKRVQ